MKMHEQILVVADAFGALTNRKRGRVSDMVLGRGGKLQAIADGAELGFRRYERAMEWFSANWPEGADWPADVTRPQIEASSLAPVRDAHGSAGAPDDRRAALRGLNSTQEPAE